MSAASQPSLASNSRLSGITKWQQFQAHQLKPEVETRPALAVVGVDGGRLQIRDEGDGPGAHDASWREDKIAVLATAAVTTSESDPEPDLPACFRDRNYVEKLVRGIGGQSAMSPSDPQLESRAVTLPTATDKEDRPRKRPELLVRTYVATRAPAMNLGRWSPPRPRDATSRTPLTGPSWETGPPGSGSCNMHFPNFEAIVDFLHVLGHLFAAAKAAEAETAKRWALFQAWAEACWSGQVGQVIEEFRVLRDQLGPVQEGEVEQLADDDPRKILAEELGYLERNQERMDYPSYRQRGLPWTSSHMESTVKLFNRRVKGSEKFWGEPGPRRFSNSRPPSSPRTTACAGISRPGPAARIRNYKTREDRKAA